MGDAGCEPFRLIPSGAARRNGRGILPDIRAPVLIGFIGAYTTFSTLMLDAWRLGEQNSYLLAFANIGGSILLGLAAVFAGLALGRAV